MQWGIRVKLLYFPLHSNSRLQLTKRSERSCLIGGQQFKEPTVWFGLWFLLKGFFSVLVLFCFFTSLGKNKTFWLSIWLEVYKSDYQGHKTCVNIREMMEQSQLMCVGNILPVTSRLCCPPYFYIVPKIVKIGNQFVTLSSNNITSEKLVSYCRVRSVVHL